MIDAQTLSSEGDMKRKPHSVAVGEKGPPLDQVRGATREAPRGEEGNDGDGGVERVLRSTSRKGLVSYHSQPFIVSSTTTFEAQARYHFSATSADPNEDIFPLFGNISGRADPSRRPCLCPTPPLIHKQ